MGDYLTIQVKCFIVFNQEVTKGLLQPQSVTLDKDIVDHKKFNEIATINHSGNLARGHYTYFIKSALSSSWFHCNDAAVTPSNETALNNDTYIFFYKNMS